MAIIKNIVINHLHGDAGIENRKDANHTAGKW